jgi:hypothetical protein
MYKLTDNHYNKLSYFIPELHKDNLYNLYNLDKDQLIQDYDRYLVIKVLDYHNNNNLDFINKDNYKEVFEIFLHFGSDIGILFDSYDGIVKKKLDVLKDINLDNNMSEGDYGLVVQFNRDIYNYKNKLKYEKLFNLYFDILRFNIEILDYDNYDIEYIMVYSKKELEEYRNSYKINICFNEVINENDFGDNLTHLTFSSDFNQEIKENVLPKSLIDLTFGSHSKFNQEIKENILPQSLEYLNISGDYNHEIKENVLPNSLIQLMFHGNFNQELKENTLPESLENLILYGYYNKEIKEGVLPKSLINLCLFYKYNQEIKEHVLPKSLKCLSFNHCGNFNYEIKENVLPNSLTHLTFGKSFNQEIKENILPKTIQYIKIKKGLLDESYTNNPNIKIEYI